MKKAIFISVAAGLVLSPVSLEAFTPVNVLAQTNQVSKSLQTDSKVIVIENGDFENPSFSGTHIIVNESQIPGWKTSSTDKMIELQGNGFLNVNPPSGKQWAELNAYANAALYQDIPTTPGVKVRWQTYHKGRAGVDTAVVEFGAPDGEMIQQSEMEDGVKQWGLYKGEYTIPAGQTMTRFQFRAISTAGGKLSVGNLLDNVQFATQSILTLTGSFSSNVTEVNQNINYDILVKNVGGSSAANNEITVKIPTELTYVPESLKATNTSVKTENYNATTRELTFTVGTLKKDVTTNITIPLTANATGMLIKPETSVTYNDENFNEDIYSANGIDSSINIKHDSSKNTWSNSKIYVFGDTVIFGGREYIAKWWNIDNKPSESEVWKLVDNGFVDWDRSKGYNTGEKVEYNGKIYQAKWWSQGEEPDSLIAWELLK
ncbi:carbohydrate-binding protein [Listeria grandensis]|uniref:carbohydrate-binding protein n=1 Tax=Listeria grandensis TaxID=1494963 RepID=UPI00164DEEE3|nr:carbohydrate-binding protein [Listeria grandensis]MBC6315341.1 hypothetical protein [Listeria grandensis]